MFNCSQCCAKGASRLFFVVTSMLVLMLYNFIGMEIRFICSFVINPVNIGILVPQKTPIDVELAFLYGSILLCTYISHAVVIMT